MTYEQDVARARALESRSDAEKWELAELTFSRTTGRDAVTLTKWAADCGFGLTHVHYLRRTWQLFQSTETRAGRTFSECYAEAMRSPVRPRERKDRVAKGGGSDSVLREHHRRERQERELRDRILNDPGFRKRLRTDPEWRELIEDERRRRDRAEKKQQPATEGESLVARLEALKGSMYRVLADMLDRPPSKQDRKHLLEVLEDIQVTTAWMQTYLKTGARSFEDALEALLDGTLASPPDEIEVPAEPPKKRRKPPAETPAEAPPAAEVTPPASTNGSDPAERPKRRGKEREAPGDPPKRRRRAG